MVQVGAHTRGGGSSEKIHCRRERKRVQVDSASVEPAGDLVGMTTSLPDVDHLLVQRRHMVRILLTVAKRWWGWTWRMSTLTKGKMTILVKKPGKESTLRTSKDNSRGVVGIAAS